MDDDLVLGSCPHTYIHTYIHIHHQPLTLSQTPNTPQAEAYALALLQKLLVGLDRSYHAAAQAVQHGAADAGAAAVARNAAALQAFLRSAGDAAVEADAAAIRRFVAGGSGLPVAARGLEEWVAGRETAALAAFRAAAGRFKVG